MTNKEKKELFSSELMIIKDEKLKKFTENIIEGTGDWFFHDSASTSGKYHPKYALGDGGLMRHTKSVVYWVQELCRTELFDITDRQCELLSVAAILHDIRKHTADGGYVAKHARASYELIISSQKEHSDLLSEEEAKYIADAVSTHMGIWGVKDGERKPTTDAEKLLHLADYCASRKEINMEFETTNHTAKKPELPVVQVISESTTDSEKNDDLFVFNFGKYRGQSIEQVYKEHKDYIDWIISQKDFFNTEIQEEIRDYVNNQK